MAFIRVSFSAKNFQSNQQVQFTVYNNVGTQIYSGFALEWGYTGVYYLEGQLPLENKESYLIIAEEINGSWKEAKMITQKDIL